MIDNYPKRLYEVNEILNHLPQEYYKKIPIDIINFIQDNMEKNYFWKIDKEKDFVDQEIHRDTLAILSYINTEYLLNQKQKDFLEKIHIQNDLNNKNEINKEYNINELFKEKDFKNNSGANKKLEMILQKSNTNIFKSILNKIKIYLKLLIK